MEYDIQTGLLKENSLSAKIFFLLLKRVMSQSELSKAIYGKDKVQLSNIKKAVDKLAYQGYIEEVLISKIEKEKLGIDKRTDLYKSTYKPLIEYIKLITKKRKETSKESKREETTEEDIQVLTRIFNSNWFKKFYSEKFLSSQKGEVTKLPNGEFISHCPIRFFAFFLEEFFTISFLIDFFNIQNKEILSFQSFDLFLEEYTIEKKDLTILQQIKKRASDLLGDYTATNLCLDYYFKDKGILLIPKKLAYKLQSMGRVPLTMHICVYNAKKSILFS